MKRIMQRYLWIIILLISNTIEAIVIPYLNLHTQGMNGAREIVGWQTQINKFDMNSWYGSFSITPEYTRSFQNYQLAGYLWCDALAPEFDYTIHLEDCCNDPLIRIEGTKVNARKENALMAENFYLPTDFKSEVRINPVIENFLVDFNLYIGLDNITQGLYFRIHSPLCHTRWNMNMREYIMNKGTENYDPGYFNDTYTGTIDNPNVFGISRNALLTSFSDYIQHGKSIKDIPGIEYEGLQHARIAPYGKSKTALAEITAALGWNFWTSEDFHFGINVRAAAPTGTRPTGFWMFEPIVGNGHHWELGAGMTSHVCLGRGEADNRNLSLYVDAYFSHLFSTRQCRTFDLCGNPLSRYMLAMKFTDSTQGLRANNQPMPFAQAKQFVPVANITTIPVNTSILFQGEVLFKLAYTYKDSQMDIGYTIWSRSCENIKPCNTNRLSHNLWGLKGDAFTFGFPGKETPSINIEPHAIPLSATESRATIFEGTNNYPDGKLVGIRQLAWNQNPGIDNTQPAYKDQDALYTHQIGSTTPIATAGWDIVQTSSLPHFFTCKDLAINRASTKAYSQKLFIHLNHTFECHRFTPYIGLGGEIEFGEQDTAFGCSQCRKSCCDSGCASQGECPGGNCSGGACSGTNCCTTQPISCETTDCTACALSQWGIWIKGGISFN